MNTPTYLKKEDKVAILCPASYISVDLSKAYEVLVNWGLEPVIYESVTAQDFQYAGTDSLRAKDLQDALDNPDIKAIIAGRGGYGCVRIIDQINFKKFKKNPKWVVGFSDLTVILSHIQRNFKIPTIHGQMVKSFLDASPQSMTSLHNALFGKNNDLKYKYSGFPNRNGKSHGTLIGGNLALLQSIIASPSDLKYDDKILFIEDVGESLYNIDRMLWSLKRAKKFNKLKGLIVGGFTELKDSDPGFGKAFEEIIWEKIQDFDFPVAFGCPAGHIEDNRALIIGKKITLEVKSQNISIIYDKD